MKSLAAITVTLLVVVPGAREAWAQDPQYIQPGSLANAPESTQEKVLQAVSDARWKLGRWRVNPRFSVDNLGYQENVLGAVDGEPQVSDYHLSAGVGLDAYYAFTKKLYLATFAAPEYSYWQDLDQLRQFSINFGAGLFGYFNRLEAGVAFRSVEYERPLTSEVDAPFRIAEDRTTFNLRLEIRPSLFLVGGASSVEYDYSSELGDLVLVDPLGLNRTEDRYSAGLALAFRSGFELGVGIEDEDVAFDLDPTLRSFSGTSPLVTASLEGSRLQIQGRVLLRQVDFSPSSGLGEIDETTGGLRVATDVARDLTLTAYGSRSLVYGAVDAREIVLEDRWGLQADRALGRRFSVRAFAERGSLDYLAADPIRGARADDLSAFGGHLGFEISDSATLLLVYSEVDYTSNTPGFDRSVSRVGVTVSIADSLVPW